MSERSSFCEVGTPTTVFAGPPTKGQFDDIALPETIHKWKSCEIATLLKRDGRQWARRCHSKQAGEHGEGVVVIFQWFEELPVDEVPELRAEVAP
jgi:hypothetical protein